MKIEIRNHCTDFNSYRSARVKSLFNVETGADFSRDVDLPIEGTGWKVGLVVGPSGSGKTSVGRRVFADLGDAAIYQPAWAADKPDSLAAQQKRWALVALRRQADALKDWDLVELV